MIETYNVDYFIAKFEAIPDEKWTIGRFSDDEGCCCALGHCGARNNSGSSRESVALSTLVLRFNAYGIVKTNDGEHPDYKQPTPKARVLAALRDIKAKETSHV